MEICEPPQSARARLKRPKFKFDRTQAIASYPDVSENAAEKWMRKTTAKRDPPPPPPSRRRYPETPQMERAENAILRFPLAFARICKIRQWLAGGKPQMGQILGGK